MIILLNKGFIKLTNGMIDEKVNAMTKMNYNIMDALINLYITLPFLEEIKITQQREKLIKALENINPSR